MNNVEPLVSVPVQNQDEYILVVKRKYLMLDDTFIGLKSVDFKQYATLITTHKEFLPRSLMETDETYKQIIPYLIFTHNNRYFLMQRRSKASEGRLRNKFSLGIGGHIRQEDIQDDDMCAWAMREFYEEVNYAGSVRVEPIGIVNDDSNDVGKVHIGFVFLLHGDSAHISVKSELASGALVTLEECGMYKDSMESWSLFVHNYLLIS